MKLLFSLPSLFLSIVLAAVMVAPSASTSPNAPTFVDGAESVQVIPIGSEGTLIFTFDGPIYDDSSKQNVIGSYSGSCITLPGVNNVSCTINDKLPDGEIAAQGSGPLVGDNVYVIVGGTGAYKNIKGTFTVSLVSDQIYTHIYNFE